MKGPVKRKLAEPKRTSKKSKMDKLQNLISKAKAGLGEPNEIVLKKSSVPDCFEYKNLLVRNGTVVAKMDQGRRVFLDNGAIETAIGARLDFSRFAIELSSEIPLVDCGGESGEDSEEEVDEEEEIV